MKESEGGLQIANDEFINAFEIVNSIHSQFAMCDRESIASHPLSPLPHDKPTFYTDVEFGKNEILVRDGKG